MTLPSSTITHRKLSDAITLDIDFDMASLKLSDCQLEASDDPDQPTIHLAGRDEHFPEVIPGAWKWFYFRMTGAKGLRPQFVFNNHFEVGKERLDDLQVMFNEDLSVTDWADDAWTYFAKNEHNREAETFSFQHDQPFMQDIIDIAYGFPYAYERIQQDMDRLAKHPHVKPTPSAANYSPAADTHTLCLGQSPGGKDELGRLFPPHDLYGFRIGTGAKRVILLSGVHPNEGHGNFVQQACVDALLADSPEAEALRQAATFDVYPIANPDGRVAGLNRTTLQHLDRDANRLWHPDLWAEADDVQCLAQAILKDLADSPDGRPDYFVDFHAWTDTRHHFGILSFEDQFHLDPLWQNLRQLEPELEEMDSGWDNPSTETWAYQTLHARFTMTFECMYIPGHTVAEVKRLGRSFAQAFHQVLVD